MFGQLADGTQVGYGVESVCHHPDCEDQIDKGLGYVCGGMHEGGDHGCGNYYCQDHLNLCYPEQLCKDCAEAYDNNYPDPDDEDDDE
jgi:hypothetical protein